MIVLSFDLDSTGRPAIELFASPGDPQAEAMEAAGVVQPRPVPLKALVDTGASRSVVQRASVESLDLVQVGVEWLHTASSGTEPVEARAFAIRLFFPSVAGATLATELRVVEVEDLSGMGVDMLLGRDLLDRSLLVYSGRERRFTIAFG